MITELFTKKKKILSLVIIALIYCIPSICISNPQGGVVTSGNAVISNPTDNSMLINQTSQNAIIDWHSFNINQDETTHFNQPLNGIALNRINPNQGASRIYGQLTATGKIILVNQAGIYFGPNALVDVSSLIASTTDITNDNFNSGKYIFDMPSGFGGSIINAGTLKAAQNGLIALVGSAVDNRGLIQTELGTVVLASGNKFTVSFDSNNLVNFVLDESSAMQGLDENGSPLPYSVNNSGTISAQGSKVIMTAAGAKNVLDHVINTSGIIEANSIGVVNGEIILSANNQINVSGKLIAAGKNRGEKGGKIKLLAKKIQVNNDAILDVAGSEGGGEILIGGNMHGEGPEPNADFTFIGKNVSIYADALDAGNAGKVVVWSDNGTQFYGNIFARGGMQNGNGGWVEVSSANNLNFNGNVDTNAPNGLTGSLLLDPKYLVVATLIGLPYVDGVNNLFSNNSSGTNTIDPLTISLLSTNVTLQANTDVIFTDALNLLCSGCSLTVQAGRSILINNSISTNNGLIQMTANDTNAVSADRATTNAGNPAGDNETTLGNITMAAGTSLNAGNQNIILTINPSNSAPFSAGNVVTRAISANNLTITTPNSITVNGAISLAGSSTLVGTNGTITLNNSITAGSAGDSIVLSDNVFINNVGAAALNPGSGRFLVWSGNPANDTRGGLLYNFKQYNATYGSTSVLGTGNGFLYSISPFITPSLIGSTSKIYDGTTTASLTDSNYNFSGAIDGDTVVLNNPTIGSYDSKNVGINKTVTASGIAISSATNGSAQVFGYQLSSSVAAAAIGTITPVTLTASLIGTVSKVYDTTTAATLIAGNYLLTGVLGSDVVNLNNPAAGTYDTANVGTNKLVSVSGLGLSGAGASNYQLASTSISGNVGTITPATLTASLIGTVSKVYDTTTAATLIAGNYSLTGILGSDVVNVSNFAAGTYDTANVGTNKLVSVAGLGLSGAGASNYQLASTSISGNVGTITPATLTASLIGTVSKVYDTTTAATLVSGNYSLSGVLGSDVINLNNPAAGTYDTANVGTNKLVSVAGLGLNGAGASNYQLASTSVAGNVGTITPAMLTADLIGTISKIYDATTAATLDANNYSLNGVLGSDNVTLNYPFTGNYDTPNVGNNKLVSVTGLSLSGSSAGNYQLSSTDISANIGTIRELLDTATIVSQEVPPTPPTSSTESNPVLPKNTIISSNFYPFEEAVINTQTNNIRIENIESALTQKNISITQNSIQHLSNNNLKLANSLPTVEVMKKHVPNLDSWYLVLFSSFLFSLLPGVKPQKQKETFNQTAFELRSAINSIHGFSQLIHKNKLGLLSVKEKQYVEYILAGSNGIIAELDKIEKNNIKDLAYTMRTNLNSIMGFARMIYQGKIGEVPSQDKQYMEYILKESDYILALIS